MRDSALYISTGACWLALAALAWRASRRATPAGGTVPGAAFRLEGVLLPVALVLHGMLVYNGVATDEGMNLGVANSLSLIVWITVAIYWLASLAVPGLASIQGLWAPVALAAVILQFAVPSNHLVSYGGDPLFTLHFAIAMLAYSLFIVATMHALVMLAEEKWLHRGVMPPFLGSLPPLLEMESLLFRILIAAFVLLTLTVVSGVFFSEQLFGRPFQLTHKTVFGMLSWVIFGWLLAGRYFRGWRGRLAVYWTLGGFAALLLAYLGSKIVLEIILKRV
ncbi:MAG TPA: cytochrome c biogenesis protein CcsA [Usitatibacteraceae bacterium]|nr:cytochrome c biogenesis protein CcsA [Usitatibacteraceae bacterium]